MDIHPPPQGFVLRALTVDDLTAAQALLDECESTDTGEPCVHELDIAVEVRSHWFDLEGGAWVVVGADGHLAGVGWAHRPADDGVITSDHYVRADVRDLGLDDVFLDLMEDRAIWHANQRRGAGGVHLLCFCEPLLERRRELLVVRGYSVVRELYQMRLDLAEPLPAARYPAGISVRSLRLGQDERALHAASEEAFGEHFLYQPTPFEEWCVRTVQRDGLDPELWLVAWDTDEAAGQVWVLPRGGEVHVEDLSVRRPWRGRGLGLALLLDVFGLLAARGYAFVRLFVDAQNATGALGLYLKAGMRVERRFEVFEKAIESSEGVH
jgi:mycothiol synthase